jgi:hypothetical protein
MVAEDARQYAEKDTMPGPSLATVKTAWTLRESCAGRASAVTGGTSPAHNRITKITMSRL